MKTVGDEFLIRREFYNNNDFEVTLEIMTDMVPWIKQNAIPIGPPLIVIPPKKHQVTPHGYYIVHGKNVKQGEQINLLVNFGKMIGKRNIKQSLPLT